MFFLFFQNPEHYVTVSRCLQVSVIVKDHSKIFKAYVIVYWLVKSLT